MDDPDDTGIRQRRAEAEETSDTGRVGGRPYGRRAGDLRIAASAPADPQTAAIPGVRPSGKPEVPGAAAQTGAVRDRRAGDQRGAGGDRRQADRRPDDDRSTGRVGERRQGDRRLADRRVEDRRPDGDRSTGRVADRPLDDDRSTGRVGDRRAVEPRPERRAGDRRADDDRSTGRVGERRKPAAPPLEERRVPPPAEPLDDNPSTGPIPVVTDEADAADLDGTPKESALAWVRFGGELVIALAAGVGIYFLFTVIWETLPHLAVLVAPLAVTGLVAGVGAYRHKMSRDPVGPKLLAVLVFAGVLLTVAPAAALLATG
ncbi:hypothetical protein ACI797_10155 [Geodermatophilus sp. SYSU D00691]